MAAGYDGSILIDTRINNRGFNAGAKQITSGVNSITGSLKRMAAAVGIAFGIAAIVNFGKQSMEVATKLQNALTGLKSIVEGQGRSFAQAQKFIQEYISDGLIPAADAVTTYKNLAMRGYSTDQIEQTMVALKNASAFGRSAALTMGEAVRSASEGLRNENSILVDNSGVTKNVSKMWSDYTKNIGVGVESLTKQQKIQAEVNGIMEETRFQMGDATKVAGSYQGHILQLGFNFNNLKIAVGNALIPIAQAVLPSINAMINGFTRLANIFAQVSTLIFGNQAAKQEAVANSAAAAAKEEKNLANATKAAGKAAKGALAGFDELNVLTKDTADVAAGSADGLNGELPAAAASGGELFGGVTVSPDVEAAVETFKRMLDPLKTWYENEIAPVLRNVGQEIGPEIEKFKGILQKAWADIARLGSPLKAWFSGDFTVFLQTLIAIWGGMGKGLFDSFNTVFKDIWELAVYPSWEKFITVALPMLTQFSTEAIKTLGVLYDEIKILFDKMWREGVAPTLEIITNIWLDVWDSLYAAWQEEGSPIFENIREALRRTGAFLQLVWDTVISPVWKTIMSNVDWLWSKHLKPLLNNFLDFVGELINGALVIYNQFILPLVTYFANDFGPPIMNVIQTVIDIFFSIIGAVSDVLSATITALKGIIQFIVGVFTGDWGKAWEGVVNTFRATFELIEGIVKGVVNIVIDLINSMIRAVTSGINSIIKSVNKLSLVNPFTGETIGFNFKEIVPYQIPKLATGAVIPPNQEFLAILGDQRRGTNIETPLDTMIQAFKTAIAEMGGAGGGDVEVTVNFNGSLARVGQVLEPVITAERKRKGSNAVRIGGPVYGQ